MTTPATAPTSPPEPAPPCGTMTAAQAAQAAAAKLPPPFSDPDMSDVGWDPSAATLDGYDPCAALGWIVMPIQGGTASSPYAIALFHQGQYIGRATAKSYGFFPTVTRVDYLGHLPLAARERIDGGGQRHQCRAVPLRQRQWDREDDRQRPAAVSPPEGAPA